MSRIPKATRRAGFRPAIHQYAGLVLIWLAGLGLAGPLLGDYFLHSTDGLLHLYRALDFRHVIAAGAFWPRLAPTLFYGYGYPVFDFYSPAVY